MASTRGRGLVTGTGAVSPLGRGAGEFYARLCAGETAIRPLPAEDRKDMQATHAARYENFSPQPEIPPMKARRLDRGSQFALIAAAQAVAEAGYAIGDDPGAIGIAMGTGSAGAGALTEFLKVLILESPEAAPPFHFPNTVANAPASQVSIELKIFGPNVTITQKDPSALNALLFSTLALGSGRARAMIAGAVDEWNSFYAMGFDRVGALRGEKRESGIVQGEGAFVILLEEEEAARRRGVAPLARLAGIASAGVASEPYRFAPDPRAMEKAMRGALADAGVEPADIDLWLSSRDGVRDMDRAEAEAASAVFSGRGRHTMPRELSVKDAVGEMAAAGGAQLVAATRAIAAGEARRALVNSFGAGGNFLAAVMESPR
jgi:nodulation protein E